MSKDPLTKLKHSTLPPAPAVTSEQLAKEISKQQKEELIPATPIEGQPLPSEIAEVESLKQAITEKDTELETLRKIAANQKLALSIEQASPETLQRVWDMVYNAALKSIFLRDMSFYNSKAALLRNHFQLAVIRADEAVENFILARKSSTDPVQRQLQEWQKNK